MWKDGWSSSNRIFPGIKKITPDSPGELGA
jgi:hypothetical protein